jgi:hypothetical protein
VPLVSWPPGSALFGKQKWPVFSTIFSDDLHHFDELA